MIRHSLPYAVKKIKNSVNKQYQPNTFVVNPDILQQRYRKKQGIQKSIKTPPVIIPQTNINNTNITNPKTQPKIGDQIRLTVHSGIKGSVGYALSKIKLSNLIRKYSNESPRNQSILEKIKSFDPFTKFLPKAENVTLENLILPNAVNKEFLELEKENKNSKELPFVFRELNDAISKIASSLVDDYVASVFSSEENKKRIYSVGESTRILIGKAILDIVTFSGETWRKLSEEEERNALSVLQEKYTDVNWNDILTNQGQSAIVEVLYQTYKNDGNDKLALTLFKSADMRNEEVERTFGKTFDVLFRGIFYVPKKQKCIQETQTQPQTQDKQQETHFGKHSGSYGIISLSDVSPLFSKTNISIPASITKSLLELNEYNNKEWIQTNNIGIRMGPFEKGEIEYYNQFFQYFTPIPIILTHNYLIDTYEYAYFKNKDKVGRIINMYLHNSSGRVYALVDFDDPDSDSETESETESYELLCIDPDDPETYEPILTSTMHPRFRINSFGKIIQKNKQNKNILKIYKKLVRVHHHLWRNSFSK